MYSNVFSALRNPVLMKPNYVLNISVMEYFIFSSSMYGTHSLDLHLGKSGLDCPSQPVLLVL